MRIAGKIIISEEYCLIEPFLHMFYRHVARIDIPHTTSAKHKSRRNPVRYFRELCIPRTVV